MNCIVKASCIWTQLAFFVWKNGLAEGRFFGRSGRILLRRGDVGVQSLQKLVAVNGLGNMVIHACGHGLGRILDKGIGGDCKNGNPGRIGMLGSPDAAGSRQAIHDRHLDIHEDSGVESWSRGQKMVDSLLSVAGRRDLEANCSS